jgi:hypothetical protein
MRYLFAVTLVPALCLAIGVLWLPPSWRGSLADTVTTFADDGERPRGAGTEPGQADQTIVGEGLLTRPYISGRLDVLAQELERLDRDPEIYARAFHSMVARSALEALLADASRLADRPARCAGQTFDVEMAGTPAARREELEL